MELKNFHIRVKLLRRRLRKSSGSWGVQLRNAGLDFLSQQSE